MEILIAIEAVILLVMKIAAIIDLALLIPTGIGACLQCDGKIYISMVVVGAVSIMILFSSAILYLIINILQTLSFFAV